MATKTTIKKYKRKLKPMLSQNTKLLVSPPHYCTLIKTPHREFTPEVSPGRMRMILLSDRKWVNGTKLKYYFFNGGSDGSPSNWKGDVTQKNAVQASFKVWKDQGIGLEFEETNDNNEAQIKIGFLRGDGSWSYVGRDNIDLVPSPNERTMNFGWNILQQPDTAIHEIGHALGAPHEHQNPNAGIVWNEEAVYAELAAPPNHWTREETFHNIIRKLPVNEVEGSNHDPNSVMHYPFGPGLIFSPVQYQNGIFPAGGLSAKDKEFVKKFYPPLTSKDYIVIKAGQSQLMNILPGEQKNFKFIPIRSKKYNIETFGVMDTVMVLFEKSNGEEIYLSGDDDSGSEYNSKIQYRLIRNREYIIRIRLFYNGGQGAGSVMVY